KAEGRRQKADQGKGRRQKAEGRRKTQSTLLLSSFCLLPSAFCLLPSREDFLRHAAAHIGEAEVAAGVAVSQLLVIEAEQVQQGRVQVVHVDLVLHGVVAELVGGAV